MGLTTENAHIFTARTPGLGLEQAVSALGHFMSETGYEEAAGADDRIFILVAHAGWISVYDTETGSLDGLVRALSKSLDAIVTGIRVEDSDKYSAWLCRAGRWVDKISASVLRKKGSGKPELWAELLAPGSSEEVARAVEGGGTFAEESLRHLCRAMNLPDEAALGTPEEMSQQPPAGARVLRFRSLHRKAPQGPPHLTLVNRVATPATVGQRVPQLYVAVANDGPTAKGLRVRCGGAAIEQGLIHPVGLHVVKIVSIGGGMGGTREDFALDRDADGWFARLPETELKHRVDPRMLPPGAGVMKAAREYHRSQVGFHLTANAARAGSASLDLRIEWLDGAGAPLEVRLPITVTESA